MPAYTNLVPNPSAEVNATDGGWASPEGAISRVTTDGKFGTCCFKLHANITDPGVSMRNSNSRYAVVGGKTYSAGVYAKGLSGTIGRGVVCWIDWYDSGGTRISTSSNGPTTVIDATWNNRVVVENQRAPSNAVTAIIVCQFDGAAGEEILIDGWMLVNDGRVPPYFDGANNGGSWTGTAHNSTSTATLAIPAAVMQIIGAESQHPHSEGLVDLGHTGITYPASGARKVVGKGGDCVIAFPTDASNYKQLRVTNLPNPGGLKFSVKIPARPSGSTQWWVLRDSGGVYKAYMLLKADGTIDFYNQVDTFIGNSGFALPAGAWVNCWFTWDSSASSLKFYAQLDDGTAPGVARLSSGSFPGPISMVEFGSSPWGSSAGNVLYDDIIGFGVSDVASMPHQDAVVLLHKPISDNNRVGWYGAGTASTTNLYDAVNNLPPIGLTNDISTNASQIANFDHNATDVYDANVESYTTKGVGASDTVLAVMGVIEHMFNTSTAGRQDAVRVMSNPAVAEVIGDNNAQSGGAYPTGWNRLATGVAASPAGLALGTSPVVRVRRVTPGATEGNHSHCCFMGMLSVVQIVRSFAVGSSIRQVFDVRGQVTKSVREPLDLRGQVTKTVREPLDERGQVTKSIGARYDLSGQVTKSVRAPFDALQKTTKDVRASYDLRTIVGRGISTPFDSRGAVSQTVRAPFDLRQLAIGQAQAPFDVLTVVGSSTREPLDVLISVSRTISEPWSFIVEPSRRRVSVVPSPRHVTVVAPDRRARVTPVVSGVPVTLRRTTVAASGRRVKVTNG